MTAAPAAAVGQAPPDVGIDQHIGAPAADERAVPRRCRWRGASARRLVPHRPAGDRRHGIFRLPAALHHRDERPGRVAHRDQTARRAATSTCFSSASIPRKPRHSARRKRPPTSGDMASRKPPPAGISSPATRNPSRRWPTPIGFRYQYRAGTPSNTPMAAVSSSRPRPARSRNISTASSFPPKKLVAAIKAARRRTARAIRSRNCCCFAIIYNPINGPYGMVIWRTIQGGRAAHARRTRLVRGPQRPP